MREQSSSRFLKYLNGIDKPITILDIGCGNGWFSNAMASVSSKNRVVGLDINVSELEQATRVFKKDNLDFVYANLFELNDEFDSQFDLIVLNASIQYFKDLIGLMKLISRFLKPQGEIHILDSPFYPASDIEAAKNRSLQYYKNMGFPEMGDHYYHHSIESIKDFEILYRPKRKLASLLHRRKDSPFLWVRYQTS